MDKKAGTTVIELAAIIIALLALIVSVAAPFVAYRWLQNDVRVQQIKARGIRVDKKGASSVGREGDGARLNLTYFIRVRNDASLPVGEVELVLQAHDDHFFDDVKIKADPPTTITQTVTDGALTIAFAKPVAPSATIVLSFNKSVVGPLNDDLEPKLNGWVRTEASPTVPFDIH